MKEQQDLSRKRKINIFWFRRDLRLQDNTALYHALNAGLPVLPLFIFDTAILERLEDRQDKRVDLIHQCLESMHEDLLSRGRALYLLHDRPRQAFNRILEEFNVIEVYANRDYEPYARDRDQEIQQFLQRRGIALHLFKDQVIFEEKEVLKPDGSPYQVYSPYFRTWSALYRERPPASHPSEDFLENLYSETSFRFLSLREIGFRKTGIKLPELQISGKALARYHLFRDFPGMEATSNAGVYLRFGLISIRRLVRSALEHSEAFLKELVWREFFSMILFHFPWVENHNFKKKFEDFPWRNNESEFRLWCEGNTGYPLVDAGMRQLNQTGYMHNRIRMITAGFLTKHLLIDWRWGEAYFAEKLLDYDLASNNGNWQWAAGTGCDAAPYFRIFNPTAQQKRFDPDLRYVNTWLKEPQEEYPLPVVAHDHARRRALEAFRRHGL